MGLEEKLGYVMLGYEKAITALIHLDYKSEVIQKLVEQIYQLQCGGDDMEDTMENRKAFASERIAIMAEQQETYFEMLGAEAYDYILNAIFHFGDL